MSNKGRERIEIDPLHEDPSDQHRLWDQISTKGIISKRPPINILSDFQSGLGRVFRDPARRAQIASILAGKKIGS